MRTKPKTNRFDWSLFDAQPLVVKQGTWEHNIYPDFPVDHEDAKAIARMMFGDVMWTTSQRKLTSKTRRTVER